MSGWSVAGVNTKARPHRGNHPLPQIALGSGIQSIRSAGRGLTGSTNRGIERRVAANVSLRDSRASFRPASATIRSAAGLRASGVGGLGLRAAPADEEQVTGEYIHNLQRQIHFLELETQLLREKALDPGPSLKNKGTDTGESDVVMRHPTTLDDPMRNLKINYIQMEKRCKEEVESLAKRGDELEAQVVALQHTHTRLTEEVATRTQQVDSVKQDAAAEKERLVAEIVQTQQLHRQTEAELAAERARSTAAQAEVEQAIVREARADARIQEIGRSLQGKTDLENRLQARITQLETELAAQKARIEEVNEGEAARQNDFKALQEINKALQEDKWKQELQLKQVQFERDQLQKARDEAEQTVASLQATSTDLQQTVESLQQEAAACRRESLELKNEKRRITEMRLRAEEAEGFIQERGKMMQQDAAAYRRAIEDELTLHTQTKGKLHTANTTIGSLRAEIESLNVTLQALVEERNQTCTENRVIHEAHVRLEQDHELLTRRATELQDESSALQARLQQYQQRDQIQREIIKHTDFDQFRTANLQAAEYLHNLQGLMGRLALLEDPTAPESSSRSPSPASRAHSPSLPRSLSPSPLAQSRAPMSPTLRPSGSTLSGAGSLHSPPPLAPTESLRRQFEAHPMPLPSIALASSAQPALGQTTSAPPEPVAPPPVASLPGPPTDPLPTAPPP